MTERQIVTNRTGLMRCIGRSVARLGCQAVLVAVLLYFLFFSLLITASVVAMGLGLAMALTGHLPEKMENGTVAVIFFALGFPMSLVFFAVLSIPGFAFVVSSVRTLWPSETDRAMKFIRRVMRSGD